MQNFFLLKRVLCCSLGMLAFGGSYGLCQSGSRSAQADSLYEDASKRFASRDLYGALNSFDRLQKIVPSFRDVNERIDEITDQITLVQKKDRLEYYYNEGVANQRRGNLTQAMTAFEAAANVDASYRDVRQRIAEIARRLQSESQESLTSRYYTDGLVAMQRKDYPMAINAFQHVFEMNQKYLDVSARLADARKALERSISDEAHARFGPDIEQFYKDGLAALETGDYINAFVNFKSIELVAPTYKDISKKLEEARKQLSENVPRAQGRTLLGDILLAGAVALAIILPVVGLYAFSPAARARILLLQGDYSKAAEIYERLLARRPTRLKLYPVLANIYLLEGRTDEQAIKVFKMILQLNLLTHRRDDINAIVAQRFLSEGRKDHDAINIMEDALLIEMRKLEQAAKRTPS